MILIISWYGVNTSLTTIRSPVPMGSCHNSLNNLPGCFLAEIQLRDGMQDFRPRSAGFLSQYTKYIFWIYFQWYILSIKSDVSQVVGDNDVTASVPNIYKTKQANKEASGVFIMVILTELDCFLFNIQGKYASFVLNQLSIYHAFILDVCSMWSLFWMF